MKRIPLISCISTCFAVIFPLQAVDFNRDIRPILSENCVMCHGPDEAHRKADLRLDLKESAFTERDGSRAVVPGDLKASSLWTHITSTDPDELMPPPKSKKKLTPAQKNLLRAWIESGAEWTDHWAFVLPKKEALPARANPIDHFIGTRLKQDKLDFSPPADPRTLARRLHLDLHGLPPSPADVHRFVTAYQRDPHAAVASRIHELMASPHFGERMAVMWLDAARYGDTSVMHADGPRDMWPWRDWVVKAWNDNMPFDQFSIEQLAGDLLPDATLGQKIASGFNRNHATSDEGGAIAEELRVQYVVDRVRTTANVWMGLTMECAQCHDHKYDPISMEEYYQFYAFFNNHADPGMQTRRGNQAPTVNVVTEPDHERLVKVRADIKTFEAKKNETRKADPKALAEWRRPKNASSKTSLESATPEKPVQPPQPEPKNLKHYFSSEGVFDGLAADLLTGHLGVIEKPFGKPDPKAERSGIQLNGQSTAAFSDFPDYDFNNRPFSFSAWLNVPKGANGAVFSDMDVSKKYRGWDLWLQGGAVGTHVINSWPGNALKVVSEAPLKANTWQHVVITFDGKNKAAGVTIYIDGAPVKTQVEADKLKGSTKSAAPFRIGGRSPGAIPTCQVDEIRIYQRSLSSNEVQTVAGDFLDRARATEEAKRDAQQKKSLDESYYLSLKPYREAVTKLSKARKEEKDLTTGKSTTMVMADNPPNRMRKTYMLSRGAYDAPMQDREFTPGVPSALPSLPTNAVPNRLALAQWLFRSDHPLTARVAVNLVWQTIFGSGIVTTPGDFGAQGAYPSHPELLDWLAVDFRENGWDVKRLIRQMLTSRTYRQASHVSPALLKKDPDNVLLARAPRFRLQAEFVRDNALAVSGLLNPQLGGPGVKPYQPPGLWAEVGLGGNPKFKQDTGDKLWRRSLYTYWKRSAPAPSMALFDAPTREICTMKRPRTNTPLQALVTMNDVQFVEAARHLAVRMLHEGGKTEAEHHAYGYELATGHPPSANTANVLARVQAAARETYEATPEQAKALLEVGDSKVDGTIPSTQLAATTVVASLLLNLDATLTRE